jgi:hypothetical protein
LRKETSIKVRGSSAPVPDFSSKNLRSTIWTPLPNANQLYARYSRVNTKLHCECHSSDSTLDQFSPAILPLNAIPCADSEVVRCWTYARPARQKCGPTEMIFKNNVNVPVPTSRFTTRLNQWRRVARRDVDRPIAV